MTVSGNWLTIAAVCSWCLFAYMVPVVWFIVWRRRRADKTEIIQDGDWVDDFVIPATEEKE